MTAKPPFRIAVLATCLAEAFQPEVAEAAAALVCRATPDAQVEVVGGGCCGQPAWNAGYPDEARTLARRLVRRLRGFDRVVVPSGSCATMLIRYYPHLLAGSGEREAAASLSGRTSELGQHLAGLSPRPEVAADPDRKSGAPVPPTVDGEAMAFHPSCHSLRGAFVGDSAQRCLLAAGCRLCAPQWSDECCGFGGLFAAKEPALSAAMADTKLDSVTAAGAGTVCSGELGCLLHLQGRARRRGLPLRFRHLALVLRDGGRPSA